jgi:hypothetical protein
VPSFQAVPVELDRGYCRRAVADGARRVPATQPVPAVPKRRRAKNVTTGREIARCTLTHGLATNRVIIPEPELSPAPRRRGGATDSARPTPRARRILARRIRQPQDSARPTPHARRILARRIRITKMVNITGSTAGADTQLAMHSINRMQIHWNDEAGSRRNRCLCTPTSYRVMTCVESARGSCASPASSRPLRQVGHPSPTVAGNQKKIAASAVEKSMAQRRILRAPPHTRAEFWRAESASPRILRALPHTRAESWRAESAAPEW